MDVSYGGPHGRLTKLANDMIQGANLSDETSVFVFLNEGDDAGMGAASNDWESPEEMVAELIVHTQMVAKAMGMTLHLVPLPKMADPGNADLN